MSVHPYLGRLLVIGALLAPVAQAQVSTSPNYQLADVVVDGGGGGSASIGFGSHVSVGMITGGTLQSAHVKAVVGILGTSDPDPLPTNNPIIFGLTPDFGGKAGGTPVTVSGFNFDKLGTGPSMTLNIGGSFATSVNVLSNTQLTAIAPAGVSGPSSVTVTGSLGSGSDPDAWTYTPAVRTTAFTANGSALDITNYGTPGNVFHTLIAASGGFSNTQYGPFLLGPNFIFLLTAFPYTGPLGIHNLHSNVPLSPSLVGLTVHFQSFEVTQLSPLQGSFTNAALTTFQ